MAGATLTAFRQNTSFDEQTTFSETPCFQGYFGYPEVIRNASWHYGTEGASVEEGSLPAVGNGLNQVARLTFQLRGPSNNGVEPSLLRVVRVFRFMESTRGDYLELDLR